MQVTRHYLTQRPGSQEVTVERPQDCVSAPQGSLLALQCEGDLNGNYTWAAENSDENYVAFELNQVAEVTQITLTYVVVSSIRQSPKVSFCALPNVTLPNVTFSELSQTCRKMNVESTTSYMVQTSSLEMPFDQDTRAVAMEVITQGIKADFVAMTVQFFGTYRMATTTTTLSTGIKEMYSNLESR